MWKCAQQNALSVHSHPWMKLFKVFPFLYSALFTYIYNSKVDVSFTEINRVWKLGLCLIAPKVVEAGMIWRPIEKHSKES